jgi:hypothetical protein
MRFLTRLATAVIPVVAAAGLMLTGATPAQAATSCGPGVTRPFPYDITLKNSACSDEVPLGNGFIKLAGVGTFAVSTPNNPAIEICTSYVIVYVNGAKVTQHGQSCTDQARASRISTNTTASLTVATTDSVQVQSYVDIRYAGVTYRSALAGYQAQ